jgi:hypothetical protein
MYCTLNFCKSRIIKISSSVAGTKVTKITQAMMTEIVADDDDAST